jgi:hypothetical protein
MDSEMSPQRLLIKLTFYFVLLFGVVIAIGVVKSEWLSVLPIGGTDAMELSRLDLGEVTASGRFSSMEQEATKKLPTAREIQLVVMFLAFGLGGTVLVMLPITWTYIATRREMGFRKNFARALIVLPICAATIVLLIQDNLALAFGLAAMVAAVRFRVALDEVIDGIYIFSSICVGLAAGIGYLGIAAVMAVFFCYINVVLWLLEYGRNPIDDARVAKKRAALEAHAVSAAASEANRQ